MRATSCAADCTARASVSSALRATLVPSARRAVIGLLRLILRHEGGVERGHGLPDNGGLGRGIDLAPGPRPPRPRPLGNAEAREAAADRRPHVDRADGGDPAVDRKNPRDGGEAPRSRPGTTGGRAIQSCV